MRDLTRKEEQILLAIYQLKENAYLITIREKIKEYTGKYYSVGTIYAPLNRLDKNAYLESYQERAPSDNSSKPIKFYRLARQGFLALGEIKEQHEKMWIDFVIPVFEEKS